MERVTTPEPLPAAAAAGALRALRRSASLSAPAIFSRAGAPAMTEPPPWKQTSGVWTEIGPGLPQRIMTVTASPVLRWT